MPISYIVKPMPKEREKSEIKMIVCGALLKSKMGPIKDILALLGKEREVKEIEKEYQKRKFKGPWGLKEVANLYRGFSAHELKGLALNYCQQNLMQGTREFVTELKKRGFLIGAISSNPQFIMDAMTEILLLDFSEGTQLEFKNGVATGKIKRELNRYLKAEILRDKRRQYKLTKEEVMVIGDAATCFPMMEEGRVFISFDSQKEDIQNVARMIVVHKGLREIFRLS